MTGLRAAVGLLTRLPVNSAEQHEGGPHVASGQRPQWEEGPRAGTVAGSAPRSGSSWDLAPRAMTWFPLVGAFVGGVGVLTWLIVDALVGPTPAAVAAVLMTIVVTGALHEDGLADTVDGLWGGASPMRRLEIMRDSGIGTYGALALAGDLLLRVGLLAPLDLPDVARALIAGAVIGRFAPLVIVRWLPAARPDGLGAGVADGIGRVTWLIAGCTVIAAAVVAGGPWAPVLLAAAAGPVWLVGRAASRRIGGFTGDILGAAVLTSNLAVIAAVAALVKAGVF